MATVAFPTDSVFGTADVLENETLSIDTVHAPGPTKSCVAPVNRDAEKRTLVMSRTYGTMQNLPSYYESDAAHANAAMRTVPTDAGRFCTLMPHERSDSV